MQAVKYLLARIVCRVRGHKLEPTGRRSGVIREMYCTRCDGAFMSMASFPFRNDTAIPARHYWSFPHGDALEIEMRRVMRQKMRSHLHKETMQ